MSHGKGDAKKVVIAALAGNLAIAACKFFAAYMTGSTATLAEAVHSLADTSNQGLLLVGMMLAARAANEMHPFGRASERYFWPFVVALMLFSVGGAFAVYEGVHKLIHPEAASGSPWWSIGVLGTSLIFESMSFAVAFREFKKIRGSQGYVAAIAHARDPTIPLVLMEDTTALFGLVVALIAVVLSALTHNPIFDSIGSVLIGLVLCAAAAVIGIQTHGLLIGESATPEMRREVVKAAQGTPGVRRVTQLLTLHLGPDDVVGALKVSFESGSTVEQVEEIINEMERRIRQQVPAMSKLFIEADSQGDLRGVVTDEHGPASRRVSSAEVKEPGA
ncbi:MAG: cation transporter [Deltaproteobacteria bacterium]|nr:cation transporter [Deltaproteobacteria bacterium]